MVTHTKALFSSVLKMTAADCVCDIGSRDGDQALLFRHLLPLASIIAFEANPINFQQMAGRGALEDEGVDIFPYAITNHENGATFYVTDVDYTNPQENVGTSSLLVHDGLKILESVKVETRRIDQFITTHYPTARRIGLWIDVEGAEYGVIEGMDKIKDQIVALHVEVAKKPMRQNQKTYADLEPLLASMGFVPCGSNLNAESVWG
ncbi:MAG: FkbM family methyltransferase, partial [Verrucomicrobiota bacterium]